MENNTIKICTDVADLDKYEMAVAKDFTWNPGKTVKVRFLNGPEPIQNKIKNYIKEWENYANIKFDFGDDRDSEIRIGIKYNNDKSSWSKLGTVAVIQTQQGEITLEDPTMNFGWLEENSPEEEYSRVVLHEAGHALSCIHEHHHPEAGIPWDKEKVYEYYAAKGWNRARVDAQVFGRYSRELRLDTSRFDSDSIMIYAIPNQLTIGDYEIEWNTQVSDLDKEFIQKIYPF